ncbi:regulatory protein RecX [Aedoeadaptatus coxii]|uniref:RecX family transcriptional regulator n=1 Tax=Aedoeadaptatus coxii TaxID=755172 RepID=UPI001758398E|nr:RecX family transcriptional regulator [Peptoniphilus coxii]CAC9930350.1 regulatory protein RecX [Peptoniphilus coxii]
MEIKRIRKLNNLFVVDLNDEISLSLPESVFVRHNLYKGKELGEEDLLDIRKDGERQIAIDFALKKLRNRKTTWEIKDLLFKEGIDEDAILAAVDYLQEYGFLNDREYAELYARDKRNINGYGPVKIRYLLKQKGVDDELIADALEDFTQDDEIELVEKIVHKKYVRNRNLSKEKTKIIRFLLSRGFEYSAIKAVLNRWP